MMKRFSLLTVCFAMGCTLAGCNLLKSGSDSDELPDSIADITETDTDSAEIADSDKDSELVLEASKTINENLLDADPSKNKTGNQGDSNAVAGNPGDRANNDSEPDEIQKFFDDYYAAQGNGASPNQNRILESGRLLRPIENPEELDQLVDSMPKPPEPEPKVVLPPKTIKCHIYAGGVSAKFYETTSDYENMVTREWFIENYCDDVTTKYYASKSFDFDCYEIKSQESDKPIPNGFARKVHINCPEKVEQPPVDSWAGADTNVYPYMFDPTENTKQNELLNAQNEAIKNEEIANKKNVYVSVLCAIDKNNDHFRGSFSKYAASLEDALSEQSVKHQYCRQEYIDRYGLDFMIECSDLSGEGFEVAHNSTYRKYSIHCDSLAPSDKAANAKAMPAAKSVQPMMGSPKGMAVAPNHAIPVVPNSNDAKTLTCNVDETSSAASFGQTPNFSKTVSKSGLTEAQLEDTMYLISEFEKDYCAIPSRNMDRFFINCNTGKVTIQSGERGAVHAIVLQMRCN